MTSSSCPHCRRNAIDPIFVSRKDAASALAISVRALDYLLAAGDLAFRKLGGRTVIAVDDLRRFAAKDHRTPMVPVKAV